jgi:hypothetical protein
MNKDPKGTDLACWKWPRSMLSRSPVLGSWGASMFQGDAKCSWLGGLWEGLSLVSSCWSWRATEGF